ncbi:MAG: hypothetical protein R3F11_33070, partial [Verrucomicrobiales bacterium]
MCARPSFFPAVLIAAAALLPCLASRADEFASIALTPPLDTLSVFDEAGPDLPFAHAGKVYFIQRTSYGTELWATDGTPGAESLVADIAPGAASGTLGGFIPASGGRFFLNADDSGGVGTDAQGHGRELWITDGTTGGTRLVKDINPGPDIGFTLFDRFVELGGTYFFPATAGGAYRGLYKTDGSEAGTELVQDFSADGGTVLQMAVGLGKIWIVVRFQAERREEVWISDGTAAGTAMLADLGSNPIGIFPM